jgi:hypothetical protein
MTDVRAPSRSRSTFRPDEAIELELGGPGVRPRACYELVPASTGVVVGADVVVDAAQRAPAPIRTVARRRTRRTLRRELASLRRRCEPPAERA